MELRHRPPIGVRGMVAFAGFGVVLANGALLLSDRAPRILRSLFGDFATRLTARLNAGGRADAAFGAGDIGNDSIVHFGLWAGAALVFGLAVWSWIGLATTSTVIAAASLFIEVGQGRYSSTRSVEASDAAFNLLGVAAGTLGAAAVCLLVEAAGRLFTREPNTA